jgi:UDP-glucose 4-epimerase
VILVTGGAGFIGSHLCDALVARGERVRVLDDFSSGSEENLAAIRGRIDLVRGSITDRAVVASALERVSAVFHLAACPSVQRSFDEPAYCHAVNATGTLDVVVAAARAKVRRLVFASSCAVYGDAGSDAAREDRALAPKSPYAAQKLLGEHYLRHYGTALGLETVALRFFNVYGPRQDPGSPYSGVISIFCERLLRGEPVTFHGDGRQTRDFVYVENVVRANLLAVEKDSAVGGVFNIACGASFTVSDLYERLAGILGFTAPPKHEPPRPGDVKHSSAAIEQARERLGFEASIDYQVGLERTARWFRAQRAMAPGANGR